VATEAEQCLHDLFFDEIGQQNQLMELHATKGQ
jgi:hypothetical protein